jgi:hypothetical protein
MRGWTLDGDGRAAAVFPVRHWGKIEVEAGTTGFGFEQVVVGSLQVMPVAHIAKFQDFYLYFIL